MKTTLIASVALLLAQEGWHDTAEKLRERAILQYEQQQPKPKVRGNWKRPAIKPCPQCMLV